MKQTYLKICLIIASLFLINTMQAQLVQKISVLANKPKSEIQSTMWGIFFEDINFAADGGIYAELVKNRSFEFYKPLMGWKETKQGEAKGKILILNRGEANQANQRFVRITADAEKDSYGLSNEGFRGMGVKAGDSYDFSVWARLAAGWWPSPAITTSPNGSRPTG